MGHAENQSVREPFQAVEIARQHLAASQEAFNVVTYQAVKQLHDLGAKQRHIAQELELSKSAVNRILKSGPPPRVVSTFFPDRGSKRIIADCWALPYEPDHPRPAGSLLSESVKGKNMSEENTLLPRLIAEDFGTDGPVWAYVVGPIASGKSTTLRMLAAHAVSTRPVVALQLQRDNSDGYVAAGATEFFDESEFKAHVEQLVTSPDEMPPLLIIDGMGPSDAQQLSAWVGGVPGLASAQIVCATNRTDVTMSDDWGDAAITIRVDPRRVPGFATGTIKRRSDPEPTSWQMPLLTMVAQVRSGR